MKAYNLQTALLHREQVTELHLHGLGMAEWPDIVFELPNLQALSLSDNRLTSVPAEAGRLSGLRTLDLSGNRISQLPASFSSLSNLAQLNLANNLLTRFPSVLTRLPALRRLDLSGNGISSLPGHLPYGEQLQALKLAHNRIKALPEGWDNLENLEEFDLAHNRLREFPLRRGQYRSLESLNLKQNKLERLGEEIGELRELRKLWLDHNLLSEIPSSLERLKSLRLLSCQGNRIDRWPSFLASLPRLQTLELGRNKLGEIPAAPGAWVALAYLGLQQNGLSALPPGLAAWPALKEVHLGRNLFTHFPEELLVSPGLEKATGLPGAAQALRFIQACRSAEIPLSARTGLFRFWQGKEGIGKISDEVLQQGLRLPLPSLKKALLPRLIAASGPAPEPGKSVVALTGRTLAGRERWRELLAKAGLAMWEKGDGMPTHAVTGAGALELPLDWIRAGVVFAEEGEMMKQVQAAGASYLREAGDDTQLRFLLKSRQEATLRLAYELMKNGGVPPALMTDLYIAWKSAASAGLKRDLRSLLRLQATETGRRFLEEKNPFRSASVLEQACRGTEFDAGLLWQWWLEKKGG
jgi:Leucine-rich repeat (LRR) protein